MTCLKQKFYSFLTNHKWFQDSWNHRSLVDCHMTKYDCREVQSGKRDKFCEKASTMAAKDVPIKFDGICNIKWYEHEFREALRMVCHYFNVEELFAEQVKILSFFQGKNVYFSAPTGYGKSLIFQAISLIADHLLDRSTATSIIMVISLLHSLMFDQVKYLNDVGINAAATYKDQSEEVLKQLRRDP